jgi:hypothetical protein
LRLAVSRLIVAAPIPGSQAEQIKAAIILDERSAKFALAGFAR